MKKFKLKIPDMIKKEDARIAQYLHRYRDDIIDADWVYSSKRFDDIPKDWLEEIKDEPVSDEEWIKYIIEVEKATWSFKEALNITLSEDLRREPIFFMLRRAAKDGIKRGEANTELRHKETQTFDEWVQHMYPDWTAHEKAQARIVWQANDKSHNWGQNGRL